MGQTYSHSKDDSITKEARKSYEVTSMVGLRAEEGYEEAFIKWIEHNMRMDRMKKGFFEEAIGGQLGCVLIDWFDVLVFFRWSFERDDFRL